MDIIIADKSHTIYAQTICNAIEDAAQVRGTGIAKRSVEYIISKMETNNAVIALKGDDFAGFCYIETWSHDKFVANSGLIVNPDFRNQGLAKKTSRF
jgi:GNAT superfamily N-acetyltransferase